MNEDVYGPFDLFMCLGKKNRDGSRTFMRLLADPNDKSLSRFVIYCRKCHYGLCMHIEIGACMKTGRLLNFVFVDPCPRCADAAKRGEEVEVIPYPDWITK